MWPLKAYRPEAWTFKAYRPEAWTYLKVHHPTMVHAFCIDSDEFWRFEIGHREEMLAPVVAWCRDQFGEPHADRWFNSSSWVMFADNDMAFAFKVRWG